MRIDPTLILIAALFGIGRRSGILLVAWVAIVLVSVLVHELGHAFAFRRYGQEPQIVLAGMGGMTSGSGEPLSPGHDLVVSVAGPLTPLAVLVVPGLLLLRSGVELGRDLELVVADLVLANIAWTILNLLPILPLDGGRVAASVFGMLTGQPGERPAHILSVVVGVSGAILGVLAGYAFSALLAGFLVAYNVGQLNAARNRGLAGGLQAGWASFLSGDPATAASAARAALDDRPSREVMTAATELLAWSRLPEGAEAAEAVLARIPFGEQPNPFLLGAIALARSGGTPHPSAEEALEHFVAGFRSGAHGPHSPYAAELVARAGLVERLRTRLAADPEAGPDALGDLAVHLHVAGRYDDAARVGEQALETGVSNPGRVAYNLACSHARAGNSTQALWWLERAADDGFVESAALDSDSDLASLRAHDRFIAVRRRAAGGN